MSARAEIQAILAVERGLFLAARHPRLRRTAERMTIEGELHRLLPGIYCRWQESSTPEIRIRAASCWAPDGVLIGPAAARLTFWPTLSAPVVNVATTSARPSRRHIVVTREHIPAELVTEVDGCRVTVPALTALDLVSSVGGDGIDRVLRLRLAGLDDMAAALCLTPRRVGNAERRKMLLDSRDEPWSEAEREGHRLLRAANITGWRGNLPVHCGDKLYFLDIGFEELKIGLEIDGREVHRAENVAQFYTDRRKWTTLNLHGWLLLHFGANHVFDERDWYLDCVRQATVQRRRLAA